VRILLASAGTLVEGGRVGTGDRACHTGGMSHEEAFPYALDVLPCGTPAGHFRWTIRKHGKLLQRSDRSHSSEQAALKNGRAELERVASAGRSR
jgi:hypothetical protein